MHAYRNLETKTVEPFFITPGPGSLLQVRDKYTAELGGRGHLGNDSLTIRGNSHAYHRLRERNETCETREHLQAGCNAR